MVRTKVMRALQVGAVGALFVSAVMSAQSSSTPVADAVQRGDDQAAVKLLKEAADVNAAQPDGMTALHWAAMRNDAKLAQTLLYAGANPRASTRLGAYTPLLLAAKIGSASVLEPLLKAGADVNARTSTGTTALMFAAETGDVAAADMLIAHGADVDAKERTRGLNAAMFAAASNRAAVIPVLAAHGADLNATTNVLDLRKLDRSAFAGVLFGNPSPPPAPGGGRAVAGGGRAAAGRGAPAAGRGGRGQTAGKTAGYDRDYQANELVYAQGGLTPLLFAARQGYVETIQALLDAGVDINQADAGDHTTPLLIATINGFFDCAKYLLDKGADPNLAPVNGGTPLYAAVALEWAPRSVRPQPRAYLNQKTTYLDLMKALLDKGADPNVRLKMRRWYSGNLSGVDEIGATPFWRAAYAADVEAMKLLVSYGADPNIPTIKGAGRPRADDMMEAREYKETSPLPPVPTGGPGVPPIVAASGVGYGEGFAGNTHHFAPSGMLAAVKYLVEELHADVNAVDHEGNTALHNAAARGDVEMIKYLVAKGADVKAVNREGKTTADMANGPVQRIQPWPDALALLEQLGAKNNHKCVSC